MDGQQQQQQQNIIVIGDEAHTHTHAVSGSGSGSGSGGLIAQAGDALQKELDTLMDMLEEVKEKIPEGEYLRGMNALGSLHKQKRATFAAMRPGAILRCWKTLDEIMDDDEDLYNEIMEVADEIVMELCGEDSSIYTDEAHNLVHRGQEKEVFDTLINYKPEEGNAGYETSPMVLHHAIQVIMSRLFDDTHHELEIVRPVSCQCGWRGAQGNWDRHITNVRHQRWVNAEIERKSQKRLEEARENIIARREPGIVYINELHSTPESKIATVEAIRDAEMAGDRVIFMCADGTMSWFA
jgi:hypothetical protein